MALAGKASTAAATAGQATAGEASAEATRPQPEPAGALVKGKPLARQRHQAKGVGEVAQEPPGPGNLAD